MRIPRRESERMPEEEYGRLLRKAQKDGWEGALNGKTRGSERRAERLKRMTERGFTQRWSELRRNDC